MDDCFQTFGGVRDYIGGVVEQAHKDGYTETILGRRRYLPDSPRTTASAAEMAERMALNAPIQGSAADIIKVAMLHVHRALRATGLRSRMPLQVHELVLEIAQGERSAVEELVRKEMGAAYPLSVPLEVSVGYGRKLGPGRALGTARHDLTTAPERHGGGTGSPRRWGTRRSISPTPKRGPRLGTCAGTGTSAVVDADRHGFALGHDDELDVPRVVCSAGGCRDQEGFDLALSRVKPNRRPSPDSYCARVSGTSRSTERARNSASPADGHRTSIPASDAFRSSTTARAPEIRSRPSGLSLDDDLKPADTGVDTTALLSPQAEPTAELTGPEPGWARAGSRRSTDV